MAETASGAAGIVRVRARLGGGAGEVSSEPEERARLVAGSTLSIDVEARGDAMFGLAVGGERLASAEWNVSGHFEVIVTNHYAPRMTIHVAVKGRRSQGAGMSDWLGPVDDYRILVYDVDKAEGEPAACPSK